MQIKVDHTQETAVTLTISADAKELVPLKEHVLTHFQGKVKVAGFRQGTVPAAILEKHIDPNQLQTEFLQEAVENMYSQAVNTEKLRPVGQPEVSIKKFVPYSELKFDVAVQVVGKVNLPDYKKIKMQKPELTITVKDINEVLASLQKRLAERKDVNRPAKDGDQVWIDFRGVNEKGEPVKGADGKDYPLILGSNTFIPGFESNLIGQKIGEEKEFTLTFPKDYGVKALANKKVTFSVTVTKVQEVIEPKLDDAFATKAGPFKTLNELKEDIKKQLKHERQHEIDRNFEGEIVKEITQKAKVAIPEQLIDEQIERDLIELKQNLTYRGQTYEEFLDMEQLDDATYRSERLRPNASEHVKAGLVLAEIADEELLEVTPEELEVRIQVLKGQYKDAAMQAELDKPENRRDIAARLLTEKTLSKLVAYATT